MRQENIPPNNFFYSHATIKSIFAARELIIADISNHILIRDLARNAGTNEFTLKKGFKEVFKTTIYKYLLAARMKKADFLLKTTDIKEKEIGRQCGFDSLPGFITTFRKYYGITPGEARKLFSSATELCY